VSRSFAGGGAAGTRGRIGAYALHARYDSRELTAPARKAFLDRFEREVDPEGKLPEEERARRAEYAKRAYFTRLALQSAQARGMRKPRESSQEPRIQSSRVPLHRTRA
jgi:hypothetical protein